MTIIESEFDPLIDKNHLYIIDKIAQEVVDKISKKHSLPEKITLKITLRKQRSDAHIDYSDWKIVLDYNSMNVQKALIEQRALEGLIAHEVMHIAHKTEGTEDKIIELFTKEFKERGLGEDMFDLMTNLAMITKDVIVNDSLIEEGFADQLFKHYLIVIHSRTKWNVLPFGELSRAQLDDFFIALLGLFPAYASFFRKNEQEKGDLVKSSINRHFEDIPREISARMPEMEAALLQISLTQKSIHDFVESVLGCYSALLS